MIGFGSEEIKSRELAATPCLKSFTQLPNVYISPDRTKSERQKHKELAAELRLRSRGEQNIAILSGRIISGPPRSQIISHDLTSRLPLHQLSPSQPTSKTITTSSSGVVPDHGPNVQS